MKNLLSRKQINAPIFHRSGISTASGIHSQAVHIKVLGKLFRSIFFFNSILAYIMKSGRSQGVFRLLFGLE
jgi:hypothetical protein